MLFDTETRNLHSFRVNAPLLYFDETLTVLPHENEADYAKQAICQRIAGWKLTAEEVARAQVRVGVKGYALDRRAVKEAVSAAFSSFRFYEDGEPDCSGLLVADGGAKATLA